MASIERRKWQTKISYRVKIRRAGIRPITKSFLTRSEAKKWARAMETKLDRGDYSDYSEASKLTLGDIAKRYIEGEYHKKKKGWRYEEYRYTQLLEDSISGVNLLKLSSRHLAEYRDRRLEEVEPATWNKDFNFLSVLVNTAIFEWGIYLPNNPCKMIKRLREPAPRNRILDEDEYQKILEVSANSNCIYLRPAIIFSMETAMRQGEVLRARWEQINFKKLTLHIPDTKTGYLSKDETSARTIPLSELALKTITTLPRDLHGRIFPVSRDILNKSWMRVKRICKIQDFRWHDIRRSSISRMFDIKGLSVPEVQLISGHKNPTVLLKTYTKLDPTKLAKKL